jgi:uncharacterized protein (DUF362 family)
MSAKPTRRAFLASGLAVAAAGAASGADPSPRKPPSVPDRSASAPSLPVAIARCRSYEPQSLRARLDEALALVGDLRGLVGGKTVTIKLNLTGGPAAGMLGGLSPTRTYHVHPNVVAAVCAALADAGAQRIVLVESQYSLKTPEEVLGAAGWDIRGINAAGMHRVAWIDTRNCGRGRHYSRLVVPWGGFMFPAFDVNQAYTDTDVYISLAKLKDHAAAGVTMACKNNFGIAPTALYGGDAPNEDTVHYRGAILHNGDRKVPAGVPAAWDHGAAVKDWRRRVPRVAADLTGARPIDLAIVDGVQTNRGGEGPWLKSVEPIAPGLLLVGRNPVCTDAVCTAVMGYSPTVDHFAFPFPGENHLKLLASVGVGANDPKRIEVRGLSIQDALFPFNPKRLPMDEPTAWLQWNRGRLTRRWT